MTLLTVSNKTSINSVFNVDTLFLTHLPRCSYTGTEVIAKQILVKEIFYFINILDLESNSYLYK